MLVTNLTIIEPEYCISSTNTNFKDHDIYLGKDLTKDNNEYVVKIVEIDEDEEYDDYDDSGCIVVKRKKIYAIGQKTHENDSEEFYTSQLSNKCSDEQIEKYKENRFQWKKEQLISKKESIEKKIVSSKEALLKVHKDIAELEK